MCLFVWLVGCVFVCVFVWLVVCLFVCLFVCLCVCLFVKRFQHSGGNLQVVRSSFQAVVCPHLFATTAVTQYSDPDMYANPRTFHAAQTKHECRVCNDARHAPRSCSQNGDLIWRQILRKAYDARSFLNDHISVCGRISRASVL